MEKIALRWGALLASACALLLYLATMPPSLTWAHHGADGGDLASAIARGALPHPPGFPFYLLLGNLVAQIPFGELAWRLNVLSAFCAASAVGLTVATARRIGANAVAAMVAGLMLACAPLFWSQAIIVEVYAPAALGAAFLFFLAMYDAPMWVRGLVLGIGMGAHPILFFLAPFVRQATRPPAGKPPALQTIGGFLFGWLAMYGVALIAQNRAPSPWGEIATFDAWWSFVSGELYRGFVFALPLGDVPSRVIAFLALLAQQFTPVGAMIAILGLVTLRHTQPTFALSSMLAFGLVSLFAITYNTADSFVYLIVALPLAALWLAAGLSRSTHYTARITHHVIRNSHFALLILLLPLAQLVFNFGAMNQREDRTAVEWAERALAAAPPRAILVTGRDAHTFTLWYARDVWRARSDVIVLDRDLWMYAPYRAMMTREFGLTDDLSLDQVARVAARPLVNVPDSEDR
ncbi:MAG: DUF2723 domain-containing protein [Chloroflexi bacterium]|nr:DUF2723 domain-containing protein [Chloroflexota bacterium]